MYIRRKVFSSLENESGEARYFSTTEYVYESKSEQREFGVKEKTQEIAENSVKGGRKIVRKAGQSIKDFWKGEIEAGSKDAVTGQFRKAGKVGLGKVGNKAVAIAVPVAATAAIVAKKASNKKKAEKNFSEAEQQEFSAKEKHDIKLTDVDSHRGLGRAVLLGGVLPGAVGYKVGKNEADRLDREGASDEEIIEKSSKKAGKTGAAVAGGLAGLRGLSVASRYKGGNRAAALAGALGGTAVSAGLGYLAGHAGAKKNAKERTQKREVLEARSKK